MGRVGPRSVLLVPVPRGPVVVAVVLDAGLKSPVGCTWKQK